MSDHSDTPDFRALLADFLAALGDPMGGDRLYQLHDASAPLFHEGRVSPKAGLDRAAFARAHQQASLQPWPGLTAPTVRQATREPSGQAVAWFTVQDVERSREPALAAGFVNGRQGWQLGWCVLADAPAEWTYREGLLHTLAEFGLMGSPGQPVRSWLDASYRRLNPPSETPLLTLPEARFGCHMSAACCRHAYEIVLPPAAQSLIDALPWAELAPELVGTQLAARPDGQLQLKGSDESCRFLGADRRCMIHQALGRQPFGPCAVFPFFFAETPDGVTVSTSSVCGSVRQNLGPSLASPEREADLRGRLTQAPLRRTDAFRLAPGEEVAWDVFRDAEAALRDLLSRDDLPLYRRLDLGSGLLAGWAYGQRAIAPAWETRPMARIPAAFRRSVEATLGQILGWQRRAFKPYANRPLPPIAHAALQDQPLVGSMLRQMHFAKVYAYPYDLTTAHNMGILFYLLVLVLQGFHEGPLPAEAWQELATIAGHGLLDSLLGDETPENYRSFMGTPEFGRMLLAFPS